MFKANAIVTAIKELLESKLDPSLKISVQFDSLKTFDQESFEGGTSIVIVSAEQDSPENPQEGFDNGHFRTLNLRFEIRTLGFPTHTSVEPIAQAVASVIFEEQRQLNFGTSELQNLVLAFGLPTLGYGGLRADKPYAGGALDIPATYQSTYPIS